MEQLPPQTIQILHQSSVALARRAAKLFAERLGFDATAREEISLAMTELATNILKYAPGGKLTLSQVAGPERHGLEIQSQDTGPGIPDVEQAMADGFSTGGSRGAGLGAVNRLMDQLDISSHRGRGTRIVCRKWLRQYKASLRVCPLAIGVATRPRPQCDVNGDAFVIKQWAESALVGIIDGLGHGQFAHRAAQTARSFVESHFDLPLTDIFRGVSRACRATRGVVMALARFDWAQEKLLFASVGNIDVRVFPYRQLFNFRTRRGILGVRAPQAKVTEHPGLPITSWCSSPTASAPTGAGRLIPV